MDYALIWYALIGLAVLIYVVLDGFDLGIGILFLSANDDEERDMMMNSIAPVWDGNETWLVLGGGGLFAVFPLAYAVIMPALYAPLILMLLGLILRGVSFEYRFRTQRGKFLWDSAFFIGSLTAALMQGIMLGTLLQGIEVSERAYAGGWFDWLSPFSVFCGLALVCAYILLGSCWLLIKLPEELMGRYYVVARRWGLAMVACIFIASLWLPLSQNIVFERWFSLPNSLLFFHFTNYCCGTYLAAIQSLTRSQSRPSLRSCDRPVSFVRDGFRCQYIPLLGPIRTHLSRRRRAR